MTHEERKQLGDLKYFLDEAFLYNNKRLNNTQKYTIERAREILRKLLDDDMKRMLENDPNEVVEYFKYVGIEL